MELFSVVKMLLPASTLSLILLSVSATPSELRLSHAGYEIISLSEPRSDGETASSRTSPKVSIGNATRYDDDFGLLNVESAKDASDEMDEMSMEAIAPQHNDEHYESSRSSSGSKTTPEIRQNAIGLAPKSPSSGTSGARASNVYLTLGMPRRSINPKNKRQESSNSLQTPDNPDWRLKWSKVPDDRDYRYDREDPRKVTGPRVKEKKWHKSGVPFKTGYAQGEGSNGNHHPTSNDESFKADRSDREVLFNANRIKAVVVEAHRAGLDHLVGRTSVSPEKADNIEGFGSTSGVRKMAEVPSASTGSHWPPASGGPGARLPVNSVGFDVAAGDSRGKSTIPRTSKSPAGSEARERKDALDQDSNGLGSSMGTTKLFGSWNPERAGRRVSPKDAFSGVKDESASFQSGIDGVIIKLAALVPHGGTMMSPSILALDPRDRRHPQASASGAFVARHIAPDPFVPRAFAEDPHSDDSNQVGHAIGLGKVGPRDHDGGNWKLRAHRPKDVLNDVDKFNVTDGPPSLVIDVLHEVKPDVHYEGAYSSLEKQEDKVRRDGQDSSSPGSRSPNAGSKCKRMRNVGASMPAFYQFVANFSATVFDNVLQYETSIENSNNNREIGRKTKMADTESARLVRFA